MITRIDEFRKYRAANKINESITDALADFFVAWLDKSGEIVAASNIQNRYNDYCKMLKSEPEILDEKSLKLIKDKLEKNDILGIDESRQPAQTYVVKCKDPEGEIKSIVEYISKIGNGGHSFTIVAGDKKFYWDGDGGDYIDTVEETVGGYTITCRDVEDELFGLLNYLSGMNSEATITLDPKEDDECIFSWSGKAVIEPIAKDNGKVDEKLSKEAQAFISDKIKYLMDIDGMPRKQAVAVAYSYAEREGFKIPKRKKKKKKSE